MSMAKKQTFYEVLYQDEDDIQKDRFGIAPLDMCGPHRNCGCLKEGHMDTCDHTFTDTTDIAIAEDKYNDLVSKGYRRVWIRERGSPVIIKQQVK